MAFTTNDRDRIRDYFGYSWSDNDALTNHLTNVFNEHGSDVEVYVRQRLDDLDTLQATIDTEIQSSGSYAQQVSISGQVSIMYSSNHPGAGLRGYGAKKSKLLMEISRAINLNPKVGSAKLLRS